MRAFQDEGHIGVLIVGDYTTRIGDPSGRSNERAVLPDEEIDANAQTYVEQAYDHPRPRPDRDALQRRVARLELDYAEIVRLTRTITVARMLERDDFAKRFAAQEPISVSELLYPFDAGATTRSPSRPTSSSAAPTSSTTCSLGAT